MRPRPCSVLGFGILAASGLLGLLFLGVAPAAATGTGARIVRSEGPAVVRARTAALLLSGLEGGTVPTALLALPLAAGGAAAEEPAAPVPVLVVVEIDGRSLLAGGAEAAAAPEEPEEPEELLTVEVFLYALGPGGEVAAATSHRLVLDPGVHGEVLAASGIKLLTGFDLAPGQYELRLLVERAGAGAGAGDFGLRGQPLTVPVAGGGALWVLEPHERWLLALPAAGGGSGGGERTERLLEPFLDLTAGVPAALPALAAGEHRGVRRVVPRGSAAASEPPTVRFMAEDGRGVSSGSPPAASPAASPIASPTTLSTALGALGLEVQQLELVTPPLPAGRYRLQVTLEGGREAGGEAGGEGSPVLPVWVTDSKPAPPWPRLETMEAPAEPAPGPTLPARPTVPVAGPTALLPAEELQAGYRDALDRLAEDPEAASEAVGRLARRAFDPALPECVGEIEAAWWEVLTELLAADPEAAPPVIELHGRRVWQPDPEDPPPLRALSSRLAARLAEAYAETAGTAAARRLAARALVGLAASLTRQGRPLSARELFRRALAQDGDEPAALLGLAVSEEQTGHPAEAVAALERLVELEPRHPEGRLRLAVDLLRTGAVRRGRNLLEQLLTESEPVWVVSLAHQELARWHLAQGDCGAAEAVLRHAARRWPDRPEIAVQLSYALECQGRRREARRLAAEAAEGSGGTPATADRTRYTQAPMEELTASRLWLADEARLRRGALARALERLPRPEWAHAAPPGDPAGEG